MAVLMFQPRFALLVQAGTKRQTIRPVRKRPIQPGDSLSLRRWSGLPYRSPQVILTEATCLQVHDIVIDSGISIDGTNLTAEELERLAIADGFADWPDMRAWFAATHSLPFVGRMMTW